jgi:vacuolar-type H+-ATPase subunit E/Vma4
MSVEGIIDRIMSDAKKEVDKILEDAKKHGKAIQEENELAVQEYYDHQRGLLDEKYRKEKERAILNRRLDERKRVLQTRQVWMDRAFDEARNRLVDQSIPEYQKLMKQLITAVTSAKDEVVEFGTKGSEKEMKTLISELNRESGGSFTIAKERGDFPWGFVLRKGKVETNMSIESLFKYKRNDLEQKAWELFDADV